METAGPSPPIDQSPMAEYAQPSAPTTRRLSFHGAGGSLLGIHIVNIMLILITLGIYYFWAKVKVRAYLWSQCEFEGDRFAYHGTGKELFIGWLWAVLLFGVPLMILAIVPDVVGLRWELEIVADVLLYGIVVVFIPLAMVGARRYRLSRTSWRGIRFSFRGQGRSFLKLFLRDAALTGLTLSLYYPFFAARRYAFMVSHSHFGHEAFGFDGEGRHLFGSYALMLLLLPFTLGLSSFWYAAKKERYFWEHTFIATARFHSTVTWERLLGLKLGNLLLLLFTLGLGWPWVVIRNIEFTFRYLTLDGSLDLSTIEQEAQIASATGEGLAGFFDFLDTGFDLG